MPCIVLDISDINMKKLWSLSLRKSCCCSVAQTCLTLCNPMDCNIPGFPVLYHLPEVTQTHAHWFGVTIQPSHPLSPLSPPTFNLSQHQGLFQWVGILYQMAKILELHLQYQSFQWVFRIYLFQDGLVGSPCHPRDSQESSPTPQFKSINSSVLSFLIVQLSHPYMTTGETIVLTRQIFVGKVMSLPFNLLSRFVIAFLPRYKHLLISRLQSTSAVILEPKKIKSVTVSVVSPSIFYEMMRPDAKIFAFECWVLSQLFHSHLSLSSRGSLVPLHFLL